MTVSISTGRDVSADTENATRATQTATDLQRKRIEPPVRGVSLNLPEHRRNDPALATGFLRSNASSDLPEKLRRNAVAFSAVLPHINRATLPLSTAVSVFGQSFDFALTAPDRHMVWADF